MENKYGDSKLYLTRDESQLFDFNYRYKITPMILKLLSVKGTQTIILDNFSQFCEELIFDKNILIKIIGKHISCKSGVDKMDRYYLQCTHDSDYIKEIVYTFIRKYLLCTKCGLPEIDWTIKEKTCKFVQKCRACDNLIDIAISEDIKNVFKKQKK
jgi:translation initiation factor 5